MSNSVENLHTDSNGMIGKSPCFGISGDNDDEVDERLQGTEMGVTPVDKNRDSQMI